MKKNTIRWWVVLAVGLVVYNVIAFAIPFEKTTVFFTSWVFTLIAIAMQVYVIHAAFGQGKDVRSKFYGFPIARIGVLYLAVQLVLGLIFMALGMVVPVWIPLILYVAVLSVSVAGLVAVDAVREEVVRQEAKLAKDVSRMRSIQAQADVLSGLTQDADLAKMLTQLADDLRYSDPVSSEVLEPIESELADCVAKLRQITADGDTNAAANLMQKAEQILAERNRLCKHGKV